MSNSSRLYDYATSDEGAAGFEDRFFWGTDVQQLTREELEAEYNDRKNQQLQSAFGSFDNYMAYMDERQDLIDSGELKPQWWAEDGTVIDVENQTGLAFELDSEDPNFRNNIDDYMIARGQSGYSGQSEIFNNLYQKYTGGSLDGKLANDSGDRFQWNGSSFVRTYENPISGVIDKVLPMVPFMVGGYHLAPAIAGKLGGGMLGNAVGAGTANAATQLALTGSVDPQSVLSSAVIGGVNPGGALGDKLGLVPDNVTAGFVQGATNSAVGDLISTGDLDLKNALLAGGIGAGIKAITDLFDDTDQFSVESEMRRIELEREMQGLPPLSAQDLRAEALLGSMTGKTDLAGLIGKDGLLSFIPEMSTGWLSKLTGGGSFDPTAVFIGPDGKQYTDLQVMEQGLDPAAIYFGEVDGWSSATISYENTPLGDLADWGVNNIPGVKPVVNQVGNFLDALAEQEFKDKYGFTPSEYLAGAADSADYAKRLDELQRILAYGPLDETYNWSENPRGDSQYVGLLTGLYDQYSTGSLNDQREYQAGDGGIQDALNITGLQEVAATAPDPNSGSVAIVNLGGGETVVDPNATLPGSNITIIDAITQGIIDGILVDNSGSTTGGNTAGNTTDVIGNENAVSTGDVLAGADTNTNTNTNTNENAVSTNDTLAGTSTNTNTNENAVSTNDTLAGADTSTNTNENAISTDDNLADNENAVSTDDVLPSGGVGDGGGGDGLFPPPSGDGLPPLWSELFGYSRISPYEGARLKILNNAIAGLTGVGMMSPKLIKEPYMKLNRDLLDAGILA